MKSISIIVPVYNSENSLLKLYDRLVNTIDLFTTKYEIIFINDSSGDNSSDIIYRLAENDSNVIYIDLNKNFGQHNALLCGIHQAKYEFIIDELM